MTLKPDQIQRSHIIHPIIQSDHHFLASTLMNGKHKKFWNELLPLVFRKKRNPIKIVDRGQGIGVNINIVELLCGYHRNYKDIVQCFFRQRTQFNRDTSWN